MGIVETVCHLVSMERKCELTAIPTETSLNPHSMLPSITSITVSWISAQGSSAAWAIQDIHTQTQTHYPEKHIPANSTYIFSYCYFISYLRKWIFS